MFLSLAIAQTIAGAAAPNTDFDFWVGTWELTGRSRKGFGKDEWTQTKARNVISKPMKGRVVEENFSTQGFSGKSWSVFNPQTKQWQQTWVDDAGSYLLLVGGMKDGKMILTQTNTPKGIKMRMVFSEIKKDSFRWDWQASRDEGKTWETQWELNYKRAKA